MSSTRHVPLCILLLLSTFSQCAPVLAGSTHVYNGASSDIMRGKYLTHNNGTVTIIHHATLAKGTAEVFQVPDDVKCVSTSYVQIPGPNIDQIILDWCITAMPFNCLPDCYWVIEDKGFSVAASAHSPLHFIAGWGWANSN